MNQAALVQRIRYHLGDNPWETVGQTSSGASDILVGDGEDWAEGDVGEFVEDGDTFYVRSTSGSDLITTRSYYGTTGAFHDLGRLLKNPRYHYTEITNAISSTIRFALPWPRIYKVEPATVSPSPTSQAWYPLPEETLGIVSFKQLSDTPPIQRERYGQRHRYNRVTFERNLPTTLVATGVGARFNDSFADQDNTVYVNCAMKITDSVTAGDYDDLDDGDAVIEAIIFGTVALLQRSLELRKGRHSAADTDYIRAGRDFNAMFQSALNSAEKEIRSKTPLMRTNDSS